METLGCKIVDNLSQKRKKRQKILFFHRKTLVENSVDNPKDEKKACIPANPGQKRKQPLIFHSFSFTFPILFPSKTGTFQTQKALWRKGKTHFSTVSTGTTASTTTNNKYICLSV
ncbi:MAG: hypothetical protein IJX62_01660 [Clostridia bacterium]|nr:hypothetical protein [Clostridia bacterium]